MSDWLRTIATRTPQVAIVLALCVGAAVYAQYENGQGMANLYGGGGHGDSSGYGRSGGYSDAGNYGGYGGGDYEDRPKINLGFKVKIPAMKFELPRFSLPKITVSARIRKPNRPRTIMLPEINLDTSSGGGNKYQQPTNNYENGYHQQQSAYNSGGGYGDFAPSKNEYASSYSPSSSSYSPSYTSGAGYNSPASKVQEETSYSFSAHEEDSPQQQHAGYGYGKSASSSSYSNSGASSAVAGASDYGRKQPESQRQTLVSSGYSPINVHPSYLMNSRKIATAAVVSGAAPMSSTIASSPSFNRNGQYMTSQQLPDAGFNVPIYDEPGSDHDSYSYSGLSSKGQYNAVKIGAITNSNSQLYQQQVSN